MREKKSSEIVYMRNGNSVNAMLLFSILSFADDNTKICIQFAEKK